MTLRSLAWIAILGLASPLRAQTTFPVGQIVESVACTATPGQSYALYLPSNYTPQRRWPVLYLFDARQNGPGTAALFQPAAELYGYIVVSSNNARSDDAAQINIDAMQAMFDDTVARFALDEKRLYASGFSGGARAACMMGRALPGRLVGVIGCAGGFPNNWPPSREVKFAFFGTTGTHDFNHRELHVVDARLAKLGLPHRLAVFDGGHSWPPAEMATEAVGWMELQALRSGLRPADPNLVEALYQADLQRARAAEGAGRLLEAEYRFGRMVEDFDTLRSIDEPRREVRRIGEMPALRELRKQRERLEKQEDKYLQESPEILGRALAPEGALPLPRALAELKVAKFQEEIQKDPNSAEAQSASRLLESLYAQTIFYVPRVYFEQKDYAPAALCYTIASKIHPERTEPWFNLARAWTRLGRTQDALEMLEKSVSVGFSDLKRLQSDPDLQDLHGEARFQALTSKLAAATSQAP